MPVRKAAFIGSAQWRQRDVAVLDAPLSVRSVVRLTDKPTGIWIEGHVTDSTTLLYQQLAHRVIQLTT